ncbi:sigma-70 family RNA polymerase sigma factor [Mucilaginibacter sp. 21P]|uniref:RNA polymerase sigma factor n=1 Tax=Mucilaginibacter sp. 21P TaxID=2778902 RepID=UPI001C5609FD|nr:sigma-70 family RNA polymerase sigma factor [Mucilaginibacter sp. 21P]QXV63691.1 sigma-70 family RNA polymerase sigma factor [Mucilaginibacter sp. 21P]
MYTDKVLIDKILAGNLGAYKQLVQEHERLVTHMVARVIGNDEDIKDVSQEEFIKVYQNLSKFNYQAKLSTWIAKIAYSSSINYIKKYNNKNVVHLDLKENDLTEHETPEHILNLKSEAAFLQYLISKLPLAYRTILTLYHLNEFSYQEIEDITGMPEGTVKNYLYRARKMLKVRLQHYLGKVK